MKAVLDAQPRDLARGVEPGAEAHRLDRGARDEVFTGDAVREPDVVLDARAGAGLAAGGDGVERDGRESLRGSVHRRRESGGPGADDDEVAHVARHRPVREPEMLGELADRGTGQPRGRRDHEWHVGGVRAEAGQQRRGVDLLEVDPGVRESGPIRERPQRHGFG